MLKILLMLTDAQAASNQTTGSTIYSLQIMMLAYGVLMLAQKLICLKTKHLDNFQPIPL